MFGIVDDLGIGTPPEYVQALGQLRQENLLVAGSCSTGPERRPRALAPVPGSNGSRE
jgi:hypothetical protein